LGEVALFFKSDAAFAGAEDHANAVVAAIDATNHSRREQGIGLVGVNCAGMLDSNVRWFDGTRAENLQDCETATLSLFAAPSDRYTRKPEHSQNNP